MLDLTVNGHRQAVEGTGITDLLGALGYGSPPRGIAVAVNDAVVPRSEWERFRLRTGDRVEIVGAVQGG